MFVNSSLHLLRTGVCLAVFAILLLTPSIATAIPASPFPFNEFQPDGAEISLYARGDEHFNWMEDPDGYTVVRNKGWFEYAERGPSGHLNPNGMIVGRDNPRAVGLQKHILPAPAIRAQSAKVNGTGGSGSGASAPQAVGPSGTIKNLVVMIRFSDHVGRTLPSVADMDILFNAVGGHATLAPTGSVRDVYFENSYGQMTLDSDVNPGVGDWITVSNTEAYYANGNSGDATLRQALREALDVLDAQIDFNDYDNDNDGRIDSIAFIHSGYAAEFGGTDVYGANYADRIWSHRWVIYPQWNSDDGVSVYDYHISPGVWGTSGSAIGRIGVIAHETGHFFGLPDLYDTDSGAGDGIGSWGLMANSWGFDGSQRCPPHFSPWSKINLGWYSPTVIDQPGQYTINQAETNPEAYRINSGFPSGEYLLIENRQDAGFDCSVPQGGVAIWHIDDTTGYNTQGYPGQGGWPENGNHYRVALLQADGNYNMERGNNRGDSGDMHHASGVDAIGPGPGNHPNTDTYKDGIINVTGITISDISASGSSMTFCLNGCTGLPAPSGLSATAQSTSQISLSWSDNSDGEDGFTIEHSSSGSNWSFLASTGADTNSYSDGSLSPDSTWFYRVRAFVAGETSTWSNTASATTDQMRPAAPTGMQVTDISASQIDLVWVDQAGNEDGYRLERSENGGAFDTVFNLGANVTGFNDSGLAASTDYDYQLVAHNSAGDSAPPATASARTYDPPAYVDYVAQGQSTSEGSVSGGFSNTHFDDDESVQSITERQIGGNARKARSSLSHRWTFNVSPGTTGMTLYANAWSSGSSDGDSFQFQWSTDGSSYSNAFLVSSTDTGNQQSVSLPPNLSGTVYVRVVDTDNSRGTVALDTVSVDHLFIRADNMPVTAPADPSDLTAVAAAYNQVDLDWMDNANDETAYELERSEDGGSYSLIATLGANAQAYTDNSVSRETRYQYRVRALKGTTGSVNYSTSNEVTTPIGPIGGSITLMADGFKVKGRQQVDLTWSGATGEFVDIHWNGDPSVFETPNDDFHNHNIGAKGGASYTYKVCITGTSTCSNIVTVNF